VHHAAVSKGRRWRKGRLGGPVCKCSKGTHITHTAGMAGKQLRKILFYRTTSGCAGLLQQGE